ncbi:MAG: phage tail family protein [Firmicutes bacterium]|nr:phage tail family protein [Bacillota bacterium]
MTQTNDSFSFRGLSSTDPQFGIESVMEVERPLAAGTRDRTLDVIGRDGTWDMGADLEAETHRIRIAIKAADEFQLRQYARNISAWLDHTKVGPLIYEDEPDKQYFARRTGRSLTEDIIHMGFADIFMFCPDPHAYATTTKTASPNEGTAPTPVRITATMTANADHLQINLGDQYIRLETALITGDEVIIDTNQGWVALNGLDARDKLTYDSELRQFLLPAGAFTLTADNATLSYVYRERWL